MHLSTIHIKNYKGIKELFVKFHSKLNVIIGENSCCKSTLIDAIRLFYAWGSPMRDIDINIEDFHQEIQTNNGVKTVIRSNKISIEYTFEDLSDEQKGAYHQYLVIDDDAIFARVTITFEIKDNERIWTSFYMGKEEGQKADYETYEYFKSYYLGALRDSTRDLMSTKNNLLGKVIKRKIQKAQSEELIKDIIRKANKDLLDRDEVISTKQGINNNLKDILFNYLNNEVGVHIEQNRVEYIVNVIKPYLPFGTSDSSEGFRLWQNSLGFNNLIYIATVLSDIKECHDEDSISHYILLIEEPEAHLHPQLQVNLYQFLKDADSNVNSQLFITTHSPTLTSRVPFENLILLNDNAYNINTCFQNREKENLIKNTQKGIFLKEDDIIKYKRMLQRYLDITRSQLFFSKGCIFVEGISEELILSTFSKVIEKPLTDHQIELVNIDGVAFTQFLLLFNSVDIKKRLPLKIALITDGDQFTDSKKNIYNIDALIQDDYNLLNQLRVAIKEARVCNRVLNLQTLKNNQENIHIGIGDKTLEYQICRSNVFSSIEETQNSFFYKFVKTLVSEERISEINQYMDYLKNRTKDSKMNDDQQINVAILIWKSLPSKAVFCQELAEYIETNLTIAKEEFKIPSYISSAINHVI